MRREDLHPYQVYCCEYIKSHPEALLLLDCGLGKTIVTLMAVLDLMYDRFEVSKTLVVAPLRVARSVWPEELKKWDGLDFLRMSVLVGDAKQRAAALAAPADVYVINRENVKWLTDFLEKRHQPWPFDMVILDELSGFKNPFDCLKIDLFIQEFPHGSSIVYCFIKIHLNCLRRFVIFKSIS